MPISSKNTLGLDVGEKRVGAALARADVRVPVALDTLGRQDHDFWDKLSKLIDLHQIDEIVIGLPRGLDGQETAQTKACRAFAVELAKHTSLPVHWQDEALTSVQARQVLDSGGQPYNKADVDALAASLILSDYLNTKKVSA